MFYYNRKLTLYEITQNYTFLSPRFQNITTSGLILYYDPSNVLSYSGSGTSLLNLASGSLNGTMTSVSFTNPYLNFNGTTSQVSVADNTLLEPGSGDWTIEMWIRYTVIAGKTRTYLSKVNNGGGAADWGYGFRTNSVASTTYLEVGNGTTSINSPATSVVTGVWYQIVGVWTNIATNSIALYKNGELVGSNSHSFTSIKNTTTPLYIGNYNGNEFAQQFEGNIGIVRMYNRSLTATEIQTNYNTNKSLYGL